MWALRRLYKFNMFEQILIKRSMNYLTHYQTVELCSQEEDKHFHRRYLKSIHTTERSIRSNIYGYTSLICINCEYIFLKYLKRNKM